MAALTGRRPPPGPRPTGRGARRGTATSSSGRPVPGGPVRGGHRRRPARRRAAARLRRGVAAPRPRPRRPGARRHAAAPAAARPLAASPTTPWSTRCGAPSGPSCSPAPAWWRTARSRACTRWPPPASLGVLNTWGAKGVFDWRSRHHLATAGLQEHDFALAGLGDADLIVATGVDPDEAPLRPVGRPGAGGRGAARRPRPAGGAGGARRPPRSRCRRCGPSWPGSRRRDGRAASTPLGPVARHPPLRPGARRRGPRRRRPGRAPATGSPARSPPPTWAASTCRPPSGRRGSPWPARSWPACARRTGRSSPWWTGRVPGGRRDRPRRCWRRRLGSASPVPLAVWDPDGRAAQRRRPPRPAAGGRRRREPPSRSSSPPTRPSSTAWSTPPARSWPGVGSTRRVTPATRGPGPPARVRDTRVTHGVAGGSLRAGGPPRSRPVDGVPGHRHPPASRRSPSSGSSCSPGRRTPRRCGPGRCARPRPRPG